MLHVEHPRLSGVGRVIKAAPDPCGAALLLAAFAPLMAFLAAVVTAWSPVPVLLRQVWVGKDGKEIVPGLWLRWFSLDELPQLINVLLGQMSLVGPARRCRRRLPSTPMTCTAGLRSSLA
jgi:lipopolysaccharide/colanic/teichoic acid biosynthesis glycosyltransferase